MLEKGYLGLEEQYIPLIIKESNIFNILYGDYQSILNNTISVKSGFDTVLISLNIYFLYNDLINANEIIKLLENNLFMSSENLSFYNFLKNKYIINQSNKLVY